MIGKGFFAAALLGASVFFGCGDKCRHPEKTYALGSQVYTPAERSSDFNIREGVLVDEVVGHIYLSEYKRYNYSVPNRYQVFCSTDEPFSFEYFLSKKYADGSYEFIGSTSGRGQPSGEEHSGILDSDALEGVVSFNCSFHVPDKQTCAKDLQTLAEKCYKAQEREFIGTVKAELKDLGTECFDWYYEDKYHEAVDD